MVAYDLIELAGQTYEAFAISHQLVDHTAVATFVVFVALHAIVTPLCFLTAHKTTKIIMVNWTSSVCSFVMSSLLHIVAYLIPLVRAVMSIEPIATTHE
ncbi:hypothetical protein H310_08045 [Aphanomyces invadans]|uniref:Uncharacterized protein n=1 Tax=Aphanomyces invadans TaxID=157072 RepID=A0A024TZ71_9STRA|nr:hypothetical protein H310_08045 [Aphanomyces invadans]ETV99313.1 hypothetical protein H310_08045 [Aphanomyces invadans]|eukprot:XP_008871869.1 hypothetical protein H310_08045 [Aphanomyces invadans]